MINTGATSNRCVVCGKYLRYSRYYAKLCRKHEAIIDLIDKADSAIFDAEQALFKLEKSFSCKPLYRMRCNLGEVRQAYRDGVKVSDYVTTFEMVGRH